MNFLEVERTIDHLVLKVNIKRDRFFELHVKIRCLKNHDRKQTF